MPGLLQELRRRNVFRVAIAYVMLGWLIAQIAELALDSFDAPDWVIKTILLLLVLGLPLAVFFAWAFELTPEGIKREKDVDRNESITRHTGRKLDFLIIGILAAALAFVVADNYLLDDAEDFVGQTQAVTIAVLPFVNMSNDPEQEYFSDGISEELLNLLAKIPEFKVAGRTSSFTFKGRNQDLREIGKSLGVDNILEGSVRKNADQVRITAQLVKVSDGFHLWSETYDRTLDDVFDVQDDISRKVVGALKVRLLAASDGGVPQQSRLANAEAHNAYLLGQFFHRKSGEENLAKAVQHMQQAAGLAPESAMAWAGLARALEQYAGQVSANPDELLARARAAATKALELDGTLAEAHLATADIQYSWDWNWTGAEAALERALTLRPGYIDALDLRSRLHVTHGELDRAEQLVQQILDRDPLNDRVQRSLVSILFYTGRLDEALRTGDAMLSRDANMPYVRTWMAAIYLFKDEPEEALRVVRTEPAKFARLFGVAVAQHALGNVVDAEKAQQELLDAYGDLAAYQQSLIFATWGDSDTALDWLERAYEIRDPGILLMKPDVLTANLKKTPRYRAILRRMNLPE